MFTLVAVANANSSQSTGFIPLIQGIDIAGLRKGAGKRRRRGPLLSGLLYTNHQGVIMDYEIESENWYKAVAEGRERANSDRGDNRLLAFSRAIGRSQALLTGALMTDDPELYDKRMRDVSAIATEWDFTMDLRQAIYDLAVENAS